MSYQQSIFPDHLKHLLEDTAEPAVSLHLPMERRGPEVRKNPIELKNALREARSLLEQRGTSPEVVARCLDRAEALVDDNDFWEHQNASLALFLGPDTFRPFVLHVPVERRVTVGSRFTVLPLLAELDQTTRAHVLALSEKAVCFYTWERGQLTPVEVEDLPPDLETALQLDPEQSLQGHIAANPGGSPAPVESFHGQGGGKDQRVAYQREFFQKVDAAIAKHLHGDRAPLILATVKESFHAYERINSHPRLSDFFLEGSYAQQDQATLATDLEAELQRSHENRVREDFAKAREIAGEGLATEDPAEVARAAMEGRLDRLFVTWPPPAVSGRWEEARFTAEIDPSPNPQHDDMLDLAAAETWRRGGEVHAVPAAHWQGDHASLGQLRWKDGARG